jgi:hypothetical protein
MLCKFEQEIKFNARGECLIRFFREKTRIKNIPSDKQFWSLCNQQSKRPSSEINQLVKSGLITKEQYYGVDRDIRNIRQNKKNHPKANWFHGEWDVILRKHRAMFNPSLIFLDSTSLAGTASIIQTAHDTMLMSPPRTFLFVNIMLNNPRDPKQGRFTVNNFIDNLANIMHVNLFRQWTYYDCCFVYNATGYTKMATYPLWRNKI